MRVVLKRAGWIVGLLAAGALVVWLRRAEPERESVARGEASAERDGVEVEAAVVASPSLREPVAEVRRSTEEALAVRAREQTRRIRGVTLDATEGVPIEGLVFVPLEWELADFELEVRLVEPLDHHGGGMTTTLERRELEPTGVPGSFRFALPDVPPGRYQVTVVELAHSEFLDVGPRGLFDARIVAPPPRVLVARCFEEGGGAELTGAEARVTWEGSPDERHRIVRPVAAEWDPEARGWSMRVPETRVVLRASGPGLLGAELVVETGQGSREVRLELARTYDLRVILHEDGRWTRWPEGWVPRLVPLEGQRDLVSVRVGTRGLVLVKRAPGLYRLELPDIAGRRPFEARVVELVEPRQEVVLELPPWR